MWLPTLITEAIDVAVKDEQGTASEKLWAITVLPPHSGDLVTRAKDQQSRLCNTIGATELHTTLAAARRLSRIRGRIGGVR